MTQSDRVTIIVSDGAVYLDQYVFLNLDFSDCGIPDNVHALQWMINSGEIEYTHVENCGAPKQPNLPITELPEWALKCVEKWDHAYAQASSSESEPSPDPIE